MTTSRNSVKAAPPARKAPARKSAPSRPSSALAARPARAPAARGAGPVDTASPTGAAKGQKLQKPRKPKLIRDSFTIPKTEYAVLDALKQRAAKTGAAAKKSEVLRAGIKALAAMDDAAFLEAMAAVPAIKTGRPANI